MYLYLTKNLFNWETWNPPNKNNSYHAVPKKKRAPRTSTTIVIDMAHCRALKSPSTVVRSIDDVPELEQFALTFISGELVTKSLTIDETVEFRTMAPSTNAAGVEKDFFRISEI